MKDMKKWLMVAACLLMTGSLFGQQNDWANFGRYEEANKSVQKPSRVVFMGNSITEGWRKADSLFFINNGFIGRGISGQTTSQMLVRFRPDVIELKPKAVVILAGTNDIAQNTGYISLENILKNIISMAELAQANGIEVVLCSVLPAYEYDWRKGLEPAEKIVALNKMIKEYADGHHIVYVDYHSRLKDERNGLPEKYSGDGVHPTPEGFKIMEEMIMEVLAKY